MIHLPKNKKLPTYTTGAETTFRLPHHKPPPMTRQFTVMAWGQSAKATSQPSALIRLAIYPTPDLRRACIGRGESAALKRITINPTPDL